jgi:hypothetical protein
VRDVTLQRDARTRYHAREQLIVLDTVFDHRAVFAQ